MELIRNIMPTDLKMIKKFRDGLVLNLKNKNIDENLIFKIRLILDELIINSYEHGNRCEYDKIIDTTFIMDDTCCLIKVKDEGEGIDYLFENDGLHDHGRGIKLVYSLADELIIKDNIIIAFVKRDSKRKLYI
ncbi:MULTISPECIES: ATP-binding protein [Anaerococcus]|uniref:ATP-binding protein n=1 Tax=Anaerococcus TaxID=165779 RepID=UPI0008A40A1F|nr:MULTISPECIES: ATP-binding protein [Anaerococcus]MDU5460207.1 ATP-binding protein [Anaerococcus vaginalis]OFJ69152.1 histidine kinase [Anaerococcus sp. HMSC065G05]